MGIDRDTALSLAAQTVLGAAKMLIKTGEHPAVLKNKITSPEGQPAPVSLLWRKAL